uniref:Uncharacterized protein n=1 Tax=viral metagenome TaxID=1070528 RepID=A0A6C0JKC3_9ZZZZ
MTSCKCNICDECLQNIILNFNNHTSFICLADEQNIYTDKTTTYDIGPLQQPNNFYTLPNSDVNFVFECTALNASSRMTVDPLLIDYFDTAQTGFGNVSETATLNIPASKLNGLFIYKSQENTTNPDYFDQLYYGVSAEVFSFNYSSAQVKKGNTTIPIYEDYVNSLSEQVFNSYGTIFRNASTLQQSVKFLDSNFDYLFNQSIRNASGLYQGDTNSFSKCCRNLVAGIMTLASRERKEQFFSDLSGQSDIQSFIFNTNDVFAIKVTYNPRNSSLLPLPNALKLYPRSYKIFLKVI